MPGFRSMFSAWMLMSVALGLAFTRRASAAPEYTITDLGTLGGTSSVAEGLNDAGQVVGASYIGGDAAQHAFIYSNGVMTDLGTLGGDSSQATAINASGQVVGVSATAESPEHAFLYSRGIMSDLGTLGGSYSLASGINASGQVVGSSTVAGDAVFHAFIYDGGMMTDLNIQNGVNASARGGINNAGQIAGTFSSGLSDRAYLLSKGIFTDLGTLGGTQCIAAAINSSGQVVGESPPSGGAQGGAFVFSGGVMSNLGTLGGTNSTALGINDAGEVVGQSQTIGNTADDGFLYVDGTMYDLNSLLPADSGWAILQANATNNCGQIIGVGLNPNGQDDAYLMTPVASIPEPFPAGLLIFGGVAVLFRRRRWK